MSSSLNAACLTLKRGRGLGGMLRGGDILSSVLEDKIPFVGVKGASKKSNMETENDKRAIFKTQSNYYIDIVLDLRYSNSPAFV